jgi:hypothetical protein
LVQTSSRFIIVASCWLLAGALFMGYFCILYSVGAAPQPVCALAAFPAAAAAVSAAVGSHSGAGALSRVGLVCDGAIHWQDRLSAVSGSDI